MKGSSAVRLHPYQRELVEKLADHYGKGDTRVALISPTGSGKSLIVCTLLAALRRQKLFDRAIVAVPMVHVQSSFEGLGRVRCGRSVYQMRGLTTLVHGSGSCATLEQQLKEELAPDTFATVVTHAAVAKGELQESFGERRGGGDLSRALLVLDEGHHSTTEGTSNCLSRLRSWWLRAGGSVLLVSATPFRRDGTPESTTVGPESSAPSLTTSPTRAEARSPLSISRPGRL